jgi:hypothetical protein
VTNGHNSHGESMKKEREAKALFEGHVIHARPPFTMAKRWKRHSGNERKKRGAGAGAAIKAKTNCSAP